MPKSEKLVEDNEYIIIQNPYEQMHYVHLTDKLIARLDGTTKEHFDAVIYLDSSARPVSWMVRELWDYCATRQDGEVPKMPSTLYVDIDGRRQNIDVGLSELQKLFTDHNGNDLTVGKSFLIVDEIAVSGETISKASAIFRKAFPEANFSTHAWMDERSPAVEAGALPNNNVRWYERENNRFRAVIGNNDGWLAHRNSEPNRSKQLREELKAICDAVKAGKIPYWPSNERDDCAERIMASTGLSAHEFTEFRSWLRQRYAPSYTIAGLRSVATGPLPESEVMQFADRKQIVRCLGDKAAEYAAAMGLIVTR